MNLSFSEEEESFRQEIRAWLEARKADGDIPDTAGKSLDEVVALGRQWQKTLFDGGWCGIAWPAAYGGRGASLVEQILFQEELARIGSPQLINLLALSMVGPVLIEHGSEDQKRRHLPGMASATATC